MRKSKRPEELHNDFNQAMQRILKSEEEWKRFLAFSARFIHYPFDEQIQILAQKPDAKAVASGEVWINQLDMRMNYSEEIGIPIINIHDLSQPIKYYYDIEDVHPFKKEIKKPILWEFPKPYEGFATIMERLDGHKEEIEGEGKNKLENRLWNWVIAKIEPLTMKRISILRQGIEGYNLEKELKTFIQAAVAYQVFSRCDLNTGWCNDKNEELLKTNLYASLREEEKRNLLLDLGTEITAASKIVFRDLSTQAEEYAKNPVSISRYKKAVTVKNKENEAGSGQKHLVISREEQNSFIQQTMDKPENIVAEENYLETQPTESPTISENFRITNYHLGEGGLKEKYRMNINAIQTLKQIEKEGRLATHEEQITLSQYVGWGGLSDAFSQKKNWEAEYKELKELLTPEEYKAARSSTLNAHYTSPIIIKAMYDAVEQMGLSPNRILEPAMGIGNFFGMLPEKMESSLYGIELDSITGRIACQLYPQSHIEINGYEDTQYPDNYFDLAIGNVPFGNYRVQDKRYDKENFLIHDYFLAKTVDKLRPRGVMAFITSSGTFDKKDSSLREYMAKRCDLLGAIRLPDDAFLANAGTTVNADILFFQKREVQRSLDEQLPNWVNTNTIMEQDDAVLNWYFQEHPEMVLGEMKRVSGPYGFQIVWKKIEGKNLSDQLQETIKNLQKPIGFSIFHDEDVKRDENQELPYETKNIRNFSYFEDNNKLYFKEGEISFPVDVSATTEGRIRGMMHLRDITRHLIDVQLNGGTDEEVAKIQSELNSHYDRFIDKYGLVNRNANKRAFVHDSSYCLLCSLEILDEDGNLEQKADMFRKRTIHWEAIPSHADTASEALAISIGEKAEVDLYYMELLTGKSCDELIQELKGVIYKAPESGDDRYTGWQSSDEYLSGNVRKKLEVAKQAAQIDPIYEENVRALQQVQPEELTAAEIGVEIGATWVDTKYYTEFVHTLLEIPSFLKDRIQVQYSSSTGEWRIEGATRKTDALLLNVTYGTKRRNAYSILLDSLNLKDSRVYDLIENQDGKVSRKLNSQETVLAQQKQEQIRDAFREWIWKDPIRRNELCKTYNILFNSIRPRIYNGDHIRFVGMNTEITLRKHQRDAVAHMMYGGNTLLAHCVGAGKTYEMIAAAMESKRLGLCRKPLIVVPNHLTEQWGADFLRLYPGANILVSTKKDFEPINRKKFCGRIVTGNYDAIIIGHTQFEKIPISTERQKQMLEQEIEQILIGIQQVKNSRDEAYTVKQLEKSRKNLEIRLNKLNDQSRKDDVVSFEELGVDKLFVDEAHGFKNLFLATKMRNVAGIGQTEAQKSSDMYMKCRYLDEMTGNRGIVMATGTPVSNSMVELYTMMRYLQFDLLEKHNLEHFDSWASSFGQTVTALELAPEGSGFRAKTRFAKFVNLPELMSMWREAADIQTAEMLSLPIPEVERTTEVIYPTNYQKEMVSELGERAEAVRNRSVSPDRDNMLKITSDGRKLALDQRLVDNTLPDSSESKVNVCARNIITVWKDTADVKGAQLVFCDLSTPHGDGSFNVYDSLKKKLLEEGIPETQIAYIHEANTEAQKADLFAKVRRGQVRVLLGSTSKMGAGTNVQTRLAALHHLDCPWRPSDIEQREGRILRQGNSFQTVKIFRYVTQDTFDAYNWSIIENKQKFISQLMSGKNPSRTCEDVDEATLSYAEVKALATGNPYIKEKMELDVSVMKLKMERAAYQQDIYRMQDACMIEIPKKIQKLENEIRGQKLDIHRYNQHKPEDSEIFEIEIEKTQYTERAQAGSKLLETIMAQKEENLIGSYLGFELRAGINQLNEYYLKLKGELSYTFSISQNEISNLSKITRTLNSMPERLQELEMELVKNQSVLESTRLKIDIPFAKEELYQTQLSRLEQLNRLLDAKQSQESIEGREEILKSNITYKSKSETAGVTEYENILDAYFECSKGTKNMQWYMVSKESDGKEKLQSLSEQQVEQTAYHMLAEQYGIDGKLTEPLVIIRYSESNMFYENEVIPLHIAEQRFAGYDIAQQEIANHESENNSFLFKSYQTSFVVLWDDNKKLNQYEGRYDIGDGDGGLLNHIRQVNLSQMSPEFLATVAQMKGSDKSNEMREATLSFLQNTLPEFQAWTRYGIIKDDGKYHIEDRFAFRREGDEVPFYGEILKVNNAVLTFDTVEDGKSYIKNLSAEWKEYHHAVQNREITKEREEYEKTVFCEALKSCPEQEQVIKKVALQSGYLLDENGIQKLPVSEFTEQMKEQEEVPKNTNDVIYEYVKDGKSLNSSTSLNEVISNMLIDRSLHVDEQHSYEIWVKEDRPGATSVNIIKGNQQELKASIESFENIVGDREDVKREIHTALKSADIIHISDPYNRLEQDFADYSKYNGENIWKDPETVFACAGIRLTTEQKDQINRLNEACGYYVSDKDILKLAEGQSPHSGKNIKNDVQEIAKSLKDVVNEYNDHIERERQFTEEIITTEKIDIVME